MSIRQKILELQKKFPAKEEEYREALQYTSGNVVKAYEWLQKNITIEYDENGFDANWIHKETKTRYDHFGFNKDGSIHKDTGIAKDKNGKDRTWYKNIEIQKLVYQLENISTDKLISLQQSKSLPYSKKTAIEIVLSTRRRKLLKNRASSNLINPLIDLIKNKYAEAINIIDNKIQDLFIDEQDMTAIALMNKQRKMIENIYELLYDMYQTIYNNRNALKYYKSKKNNLILLPLHEPDNIIEKLLKDNYYQKKHWCFNAVYINKIEYMLDFLAAFIELDYMPIKESNKSINNISQEIKVAVWFRDTGKCTRCQSKNHLMYNFTNNIVQEKIHQNNIQLICENCNRHNTFS